MKRFISFIASSVLAFGLQQDIKTPLQNTNYQIYVKQRSNITKSDIEMLCNIIYEINQAKCKDIIQQNYTLNKSQKQNIKSLLKILDKVILIAKNEMTNKYDEKVYYSSLALKNLLESLINDTYMQIVGNFNALNSKDFDCLEYGKKVHEINELLNA